MKNHARIRSFLSIAGVTVALITGCSSADGVPPDPQETRTVQDEVVQESVPPTEVEEEPYDPTPWVPSTEIYDDIDASCGTQFSETAELVVEPAATLATAKYVGSAGELREITECALKFTNSTITWTDIEAGIEFHSPVAWIDEDGVWAGAGKIVNGLLIVEFFYMGNSSY